MSNKPMMCSPLKIIKSPTAKPLQPKYDLETLLLALNEIFEVPLLHVKYLRRVFIILVYFYTY